MKRKVSGLTMIELILAILLLGIVMSVSWLAFLHGQQKVRRMLSLSHAVQGATVLVERVARDVRQMIDPPWMGDKPLVISEDGRGLSFYVTTITPEDKRGMVYGRSVTYHLQPITRTSFQVMRDGRSLGMRVRDWRFRYVAAGTMRAGELWLIDAAGSLEMARSRLGEDPAKPFRSGAPPEELILDQDVIDVTPGSPITTVTAGTEPYRRKKAEEKLSGPAKRAAPVTTPLDGPDVSLDHAGPFLVMEATVIDDDGAEVRRVMIFDLINAHLSAHHGISVPVPDTMLELRGKRIDLPRTPVEAMARPRELRLPPGAKP